MPSSEHGHPEKRRNDESQQSADRSCAASSGSHQDAPRKPHQGTHSTGDTTSHDTPGPKKETSKRKASGKAKKTTGKLRKQPTGKLGKRATGKIKPATKRTTKPHPGTQATNEPDAPLSPPQENRLAPAGYVSDVEITTSKWHKPLPANAPQQPQETPPPPATTQSDPAPSATDSPPPDRPATPEETAPSEPLHPEGAASVMSYLSATRGIEANIDLAELESHADKRLPARREPDRPPRGGGKKRFIVGSEIGRGGMGSVRTLFDQDIRRHVAMKVLIGGREAPKEKQVRFLEEAQITGQLEHPNIVPVHDVGVDPRGHLYFTMKLVHGESLLDVIEATRGQVFGRRLERGYTLTRLLQIFMKVCDAVDFAHAKGVLHRDLKPENVMVGDYGEVLLMDWGLAKVAGREGPRPSSLVVMTDRAESGRVQTLDGSVVGTPGHMSPEQARGYLEQVDERSDIYALGCILYEILCCEPPYPGNDPERLIKMVKRGRFLAPSKRVPERGIPRELEGVVLKAMAYDKEARYARAGELKADIEAFLEGRTLASVSYSPRQRVTKFVRRHYAAVLVALIVFASLGVLLGTVLLSVISERDKLEERLGATQASLRKAQDPRTEAEQQESGRVLGELDRLLAQGRLAEVRSRLAREGPLDSLEQRLPGATGRWLTWRIAQDWHEETLLPLEVPAEHGTVQSVAADPLTRTIWLGTNSGALLSLTPHDTGGTPQGPRWRHPQRATVSALHTDEQGLLLGDAEGYVHRLSRGGTHLWQRRVSAARIERLERLGEQLLVLTSEGLHRLPLNTHRAGDGGPQKPAQPWTSLLQELDGEVSAVHVRAGHLALAGSCGQVLVQTLAGERVVHQVAAEPVRGLAFAPQARELFVRTRHRLARLELVRSTPPRLRQRHLCEVALGSCLARDATATLWHDTADGLVRRHATTGVVCAVYTPPKGMHLHGVRGIVTCHDALVLYTTAGEVFLRLPRRRSRAAQLQRWHLAVPDDDPLLDVALSSENAGEVLAALTDGARLYLLQREEVEPVPVSLATDTPRAVGFDAAGDYVFVGDAAGRLFVAPLAALLHDRAGDTPRQVGQGAWHELDTRLSSVVDIHTTAKQLLLASEDGAVELMAMTPSGEVPISSRFAIPKSSTTRDSPSSSPAALCETGWIARAAAARSVEFVAAGRTSVSATVELPHCATGNVPRVTALAWMGPQQLLVGDNGGRLHAYRHGSPEAHEAGATNDGQERWSLRWSVQLASAPLKRLKVAHSLLLAGTQHGEVSLWQLPKASAPPSRIATLAPPTHAHHAPPALAAQASQAKPRLLWPEAGSAPGTQTLALAQPPGLVD